MRATCLALWWSVGLALAVSANEGVGGPGSSGGNPTAVISSLRDNFIFSSPTPTRMTPTQRGVTYDFALLGFVLDVEQLTEVPLNCPVRGFRRTCTGDSFAVTQVVTIVFADGGSYRLRFQDTGIGPVRLERYVERIVATFSQGSSQLKSRKGDVR